MISRVGFAAIVVLLLCTLVGCCTKRDISDSRRFKDPQSAVSVYFDALERVDVNRMLESLYFQNEPARCAAIHSMAEACPFIVLAHGHYEQPDANAQAYFDEIVSNTGLSFMPGITSYNAADPNKAEVILYNADRSNGFSFQLAKVKGTWKIDAAATFGELNFNCKPDRLKLEALRELNQRIKRGDFKCVRDAGEAVKKLGFEIA